MVDSAAGKLCREAALNSDWPAELLSRHPPLHPTLSMSQEKTERDRDRSGIRGNDGRVAFPSWSINCEAGRWNQGVAD